MGVPIVQIKELKADPVKSGKLSERVDNMLHQMFPNAQSVHFAPYDEITHSSVVVEQDYWNNLIREMGKMQKASD